MPGPKPPSRSISSIARPPCSRGSRSRWTAARLPAAPPPTTATRSSPLTRTPFRASLPARGTRYGRLVAPRSFRPHGEGNGRALAAARRRFSAVVEAGPAPEAAPLEQRQHALAEPVELLEVRIAGEDELFDPHLGVLGDPLGDLLVAADQRRAGAAAAEADPGPEVRRDLEMCRRAAVQL